MSEQKDYPYVNRMNIQYGPLEIVQEEQISDSCSYRWFNQTLCQVNDTWVRLGVCQGEYHWHEHADTDEFFYVIEGKWIIDLDDRTVELGPRQAFVVPKGVRHRPRAPVRTVVLMAEKAGVVPTGTPGINSKDPIFHVKPRDWGKGRENASREIDETLYG